jgi:hypothetical protein
VHPIVRGFVRRQFEWGFVRVDGPWIGFLAIPWSPTDSSPRTMETEGERPTRFAMSREGGQRMGRDNIWNMELGQNWLKVSNWVGGPGQILLQSLLGSCSLVPRGDWKILEFSSRPICAVQTLLLFPFFGNSLRESPKVWFWPQLRLRGDRQWIQCRYQTPRDQRRRQKRRGRRESALCKIAFIIKTYAF